MSLTTITVTGSYPAGAGSSVANGFVTFVPTARVVNAAGHTIIPQLPIQVPLQLGAFSLPNVITTDNAGLSPAGWAWQVTENISGVAAEPYFVFIPSTFGETVDLAQLAEAQAGPVITAYANVGAPNTFTQTNTFSGELNVTGTFELDGTGITTPPGGTTEYLRADGTWDVPAGGAGGIDPPAGDIGGTALNPTVVSTHLTNPLPAAQGGTGAASLSAAGLLQASNNLSDIASASTARTNLGLGSAAVQPASAFDTAGAAAAAQANAQSFATSAVGVETTRAQAAEATKLAAASNLSDLGSATTARTNLGLGTSATENVGTGAGTVAAGNDSRITGALQATGGTMSGPIAMGSSKITGLGNGSAITDAATFGQIPTSASGIGGLLAASNLSDLANATTARGNLTAAKSGTNSDITSLTGLTTPLAASEGGTGAGSLAAAGLLQSSNNLSDVTSASTARTNLGLTSAATASLPLSIANGGTGSATQPFVDLTTSQNIAGVKTFTGEVIVPTPVNPGDAVTKAYADAISLGLAVKASCQEATTAALPANTYANGTAGIGATLAGNATGVLTVDGITVAAGDRVLVQNEAAAANNGTYLCTTAGASGVAYVLTRTADMDAPAQIPGAFVFVEKGAVNAAAGFVVAGAGPYTIGTTAIAWTQFSGAGEITAGIGLSKTGNTVALATPVSAANGGTGASSLAAAGVLQSGNNLSDVTSAATSRTNLGLGSAAQLASSAVAQAANNLSDLASEAAARTNLGLGSAALLASSAVALTANNLSDLVSTTTARGNLAAARSGANADITSLTGLTTPLSLTEGGTGQASAQAALNALASGVSAAQYLRGNGTNIALSAILAADLPAATTSAQGAVLATQVVVGAPTGTYATDVATINAAITAAGTYGTIYFPYSATAYNVDGLAPLTGQTWYGQATLKRPTASTASVVTATGISSLTMRGLTIDGNSASTATSNAAVYLINTTFTVLQNLTVQNCPTGNAGIILRGAVRGLVDGCQITGVGYGVLVGLNHGDAYACYGTIIRNCLIDTTANDAIFISENLGSVGSVTVVGSVYGTVVAGCTVRNFGDCGVEVGSGSLYTQVSGCTFIGISNASGNNGILFRDAAHSSVTGCTVSNLTKTGSTGVYCVNLNGTNSYIDITDVNIYNVGYGIIAVGGTSPSALGTAAGNITVTGGVVNATSADGVQMTNVSGFAITGLAVIAAGNQGISVGKFSTAGSGSTDGTISGCRIMNSGQATAGSYSGIVLFQASADIAISNCRIGDNQGSKTQGYGIRIFDTTVTNTKISNCDTTNGGTVNNFLNATAAGAGIEVYACTGISAQGLLTATTQYAASWEPSDHNLVAWSFDTAVAALSSTLVTNGCLYLVGIYARQPFTTTKAYYSMATAGLTPTASENWIGLYNLAGTLCASKEIDSNVNTALGLQTITWTSPYSGPAGMYWIALLFNAATAPTLYRASTPTDNATNNVGLTAPYYRVCQQGTSLTALPSPLTVASNAISNTPSTPRNFWVAID